MSKGLSNLDESPSSCPAMSSLARPGLLVGAKYELESVIDFGGMGVIWRAKHAALGQVVAIKIIASRFTSSRVARTRFAQEARAAAALRSRYAVQVSDYGELDDGTPYIVMEYLQGEALDRRIHRLGPLGIEEAARVLAHVGRALTAAHAAGIVHRDIKPENIFLATTDEDDGFIAKVLDFGVAKMNLDQLATGTTRTGALLGTPRYMSPEQARGSRSVDYRTDLYSLGAVAYTMLTGNLVFDADTLGELVLMTCGASLPSIVESAPWVLPQVDEWFHRACARERDERFESALQMVEEFYAAAGLAAPPRNSIPSWGVESSGGSEAAITILRPRSPMAPHAGLAFARCCAVTVQDKGEAGTAPEPPAPPRTSLYKWPLLALIGAAASVSLVVALSAWVSVDSPARAHGHASAAALVMDGNPAPQALGCGQPIREPEAGASPSARPPGPDSKPAPIRLVLQRFAPAPVRVPEVASAEPRKDKPTVVQPAPSTTGRASAMPGPLEERL